VEKKVAIPVDNATGKVFGKFYEYEGIYPYLDSFKEFSKAYGFAKLYM